LIFAVQQRLAPDQYDLMVGKYLFYRQSNLGGVVDLGDERADPALLGEGWGARQAYGDGVCRRIAGRARLFAPLDVPETLDVTVRAAGAGTLAMDVNGVRVAELPLTADLAPLRVRVEGGRWRRELNEIALAVSPGGQALVDRIVFERLEGR
jgi:hypothetical protein